MVATHWPDPRNRSTWFDPAPSGYLIKEGGHCEPFLHIVISGASTDIPLKRQIEYREVLLGNLRYAAVKKVHVLWEGLPPNESTLAIPDTLRSKLIHGAVNHGRLRFLSAAHYINRNIPVNEVVLLTNADILVAGGFTCDSLTAEKLPHDTVLVPQRIEEACHFSSAVAPSASCDCRLSNGMKGQGILGNLAGHTRLVNCFDSYLLRSPLPARLLTEQRLGFMVGGQWGSENAWVVELRAAGVSVYSPPCGLFRLVHHHCSQLRPKQLTRIDSVRALTRPTDATNPACYADLCRKTCQGPYIPYDDPISRLCQNVTACLSSDLNKPIEHHMCRAT